MASPLLVLVDPRAQLCNRLFNSASLIAFAHEHDLPLVNLAFARYAHLFPSTRGDLLCRYPVRRSRLPAQRGRGRLGKVAQWLADASEKSRFGSSGEVVNVERSGVRTTLEATPTERASLVGDLDDEAMLERVRASRITFFRGLLFRSPTLLLRHRQVVCDFFRPDRSVQNTVAQHVAAARRGVDHLVGVHVRRGDYRTFLDGQHFYPLAEYEARMRAMANLRSGRVRFLVCSDEDVDLDAGGQLDVAPGPGTPLQDLHALAACDYLIGPPSTFGAWASFYGGVPRWVMGDAEDVPPLDQFRVST